MEQKKLIDLPEGVVQILVLLANKENRSTKNHMENVLIAYAKKNKRVAERLNGGMKIKV